MPVTYTDVMNAFFTCNHLTTDVMNAFNECDSEAFKRYCIEKIHEEYSLIQFVKCIESDGTIYGIQKDDAMFEITKEIYGNDFSIGDIQKVWNKYTDKSECDIFIVENEADYVFKLILDDLTGCPSKSILGDECFAYDWGDGELADKDGCPFFYHVELFQNNNGEGDVLVQRVYSSKTVAIKLASDDKKELLSMMQNLQMDTVITEYEFAKATKNKNSIIDRE